MSLASFCADLMDLSSLADRHSVQESGKVRKKKSAKRAPRPPVAPQGVAVEDADRVSEPVVETEVAASDIREKRPAPSGGDTSRPQKKRKAVGSSRASGSGEEEALFLQGDDALPAFRIPGFGVDDLVRLRGSEKFARNERSWVRRLESDDFSLQFERAAEWVSSWGEPL